jgi:chemotaxis protein methyltransferase CheR
MGAAAPVTHGLSAVPELSERDFRRVCRVVRDCAGISLGPAKRALVVGRLMRRLSDLELDSFRAYVDLVAEDPTERACMIERLCTHETQFFREPSHFELLERELASRWREQAGRGVRSRRVRIWSAGCASGEEPYSLAMSLLAAFGDDVRWQLSVLATDLSNAVLATARRALYPIEQHIELPEHHLRRFALRGVREQRSWMKIGPAARSLVQFQPLNLVAAQWPVEGPFDAIFCRNVLIYFDADRRRRVVERLLGCLPVGGLLFLGHAETLHGMNACVRMVAPTVYERTREGLPG